MATPVAVTMVADTDAAGVAAVMEEAVVAAGVVAGRANPEPGAVYYVSNLRSSRHKRKSKAGLKLPCPIAGGPVSSRRSGDSVFIVLAK